MSTFKWTPFFENPVILKNITNLILVRDSITNQIHIDVMRTQYFLRKHLYKRSLSSLTRSLPSFTLFVRFTCCMTSHLQVVLTLYPRTSVSWLDFGTGRRVSLMVNRFKQNKEPPVWQSKLS